MQKNLVGVFIIVVIALAVVAFRQHSFIKSKEVHYHAGFQVYVDDKLMDFSDLKYMHLKPCGNEKEHEKEDEQIEKAHLHDGVGDMVHVHREHIIWRDLFINLKFSISRDVVAYNNGKKIDDPLDQPIKPYESMVFFIGKTTNIEEKLKNSVTKKHLQEIESRSENCGVS